MQLIKTSKNGISRLLFDYQDGSQPVVEISRKRTKAEHERWCLYKIKHYLADELQKYLVHRKLAYQFGGHALPDRIIMVEKLRMIIANKVKGDGAAFLLIIRKHENDFLRLEPKKECVWNARIRGLLALNAKYYGRYCEGL